MFRFAARALKVSLRIFQVLLLCFSTVSIGVAGPEPVLQIGSKTYTASELLSLPDVENITITNDPAYGRTMHYRALKAANLFAETKFREDDVIQFRCADGFVAPISKDRIMGVGPGRSTAYIAIEDPQARWPDLSLKGHTGTAGPFYLVWLRPELSGILQEEWPFKIVGFDVKGSMRELYPKIVPRSQSDPKVAHGLKLFQMTCFACHTMNKQGPSQVGPDLNLPMNPTEYFKDSLLPRYIRDPKSIRSWDASKMPGFDSQTFSDEDISAVISYLKEMAAEKQDTRVK